MGSPTLANSNDILTVRTSIVSGIVVVGAAILGGLVILSHLRGRPVAHEKDDEDIA